MAYQTMRIRRLAAWVVALGVALSCGTAQAQYNGNGGIRYSEPPRGAGEPGYNGNARPPASAAVEGSESAEDRAACTKDVYRVCWRSIPNRELIAQCLENHLSNLSPGCYAVMTRP